MRALGPGPPQTDLDWLPVVADPVRVRILHSLSGVAEATAADLARRGQASDQTLRRHLEALAACGLVLEHPGESDGETPGRPPTRYSLHPDVRDNVKLAFRALSQKARARPPEGRATSE